MIEDTQQSILSQLKALILTAAEAINHHLDPQWPCYDQRADDYGSEVLYSYSSGGITRNAIDGFIMDPGAHNREVGHRRILLDRDSIGFGIGQTETITAMQEPRGTWFNPQRDARELGFTGWPPPGYIPNNVVFPRWNFDIATAGTMTSFSCARRPGRATLHRHVRLRNAWTRMEHDIFRRQPTRYTASGPASPHSQSAVPRRLLHSRGRSIIKQ